MTRVRSNSMSPARGVLIAILAALFLSPSAQLVAAAAPGGAKRPAKGTYGLRLPPKNFQPPKISIAEAEYDWGTVLQGQIVTHAYTVRNDGGMPLRIEQVRASCGCTTVDYDKIIAPGKTGQVTLRVDTKRFSKQTKKSAQVYSNATSEPLRLAIGGKIDSPLAFEPSLPRIQKIRGEDAPALEIKIRRTSQNPLTLTGVEVPPTKKDLVDLALETVEEGDLWVLKVTPKIADTAGPYHYVEVSVLSEIEGKKYPIPIRVSITLKDRIVATPTSVYFGARHTSQLKTSDAEPLVRNLEIKTLSPDHKFQITGVNVVGSTFQGRVEPIEQGKRYRLVVTLPKLPEVETRRVMEKVVVTTDDQMVPKLEIRATANFSYRASAAGALRPAAGPVRAPTPPARAPSTPARASSTPGAK